MKIMNKFRHWLIAPLMEHINQERTTSLSSVATAIKMDVVNQVMHDTTEKMVSLNHILSTTYRTEERSLGLVFQPPKNLADAMMLLSHLAPIFDFYYRRSGDYELFNVLIHNYEMVWTDVKKCVYMPNGISLESVRFDDLGMNGLLEALHVFAHGLNDYNIPDQYTAYNGGLSELAISQLYNDITGGKITIPESDIWGNLLGNALQYSAVQVLSEIETLHNAGKIRREVGEALMAAINKIAEARSKNAKS